MIFCVFATWAHRSRANFNTTGTITQWGEVSNTKKDRSKSKVKDATSTTFGDSANTSRVSRGGRAGFDSGRGGRGRGTDRGRGGRGRGASVVHTNGTRKENEPSTAAAESTAWEDPVSGDKSAWDTAKPAEDNLETPAKPAQESAPTNAAAPTTIAVPAKPTSSIIPDGVKKSWASIFAPAPAPKKAPEPVAEQYVTIEVCRKYLLIIF